MSEVMDERFSKGNVAQALRKILYPEITEHQVEAIVVCLMAHLLIENKLNGLLYRWLRQDAPELRKIKRYRKLKTIYGRTSSRWTLRRSTR